MSRLVFALSSIVVVLLLAGPVQAQSASRLYIIDHIQVGVRSGTTGTATVLETLRTGASVTRLADSPDGQWVKVRTQAGTEGWIMARYLMENAPAAALLADMPSDQAALLAGLRQENKQLQDKVAEAEGLARQLQSKYDRLYADSQATVSLRKNHDEMQGKLEEQTARLHELEAENQSLNFTSNLGWFLAGGSVLVVGWLLGWLFGRRKRSSSWSSRLRY